MSDKIPRMTTNGVDSSIGVLIKSVSRLEVTIVVLDMVISSFSLETVIVSSSSFFLSLSYVARVIFSGFIAPYFLKIISPEEMFVLRFSPWIPFSSLFGISLQPIHLSYLIMPLFPSFSLPLNLVFLYLRGVVI
jgi:hypothetical protein